MVILGHFLFGRANPQDSLREAAQHNRSHAERILELTLTMSSHHWYVSANSAEHNEEQALKSIFRCSSCKRGKSLSHPIIRAPPSACDQTSASSGSKRAEPRRILAGPPAAVCADRSSQGPTKSKLVQARYRSRSKMIGSQGGLTRMVRFAETKTHRAPTICDVTVWQH